MNKRPHALPLPATTHGLADLRACIRTLEGWGAEGDAGTLPFGLAAVDAALPGGGLPLACVHEILPADPWHDAAATGFAAVLAARLAGHLEERMGQAPVLWLSRARDLHPPGLVPYGLSPNRLVVGRLGSRTDLLWALEEAGRSASLAAVVGEGVAPGLVESRRLQLAAEAGGVTMLLLGRSAGSAGTAAATAIGGTTAVSRWRIAAAPSRPAETIGLAEPGIGQTVWHVELLRCRGGRPGGWTLLWRGRDLGLVPVDREGRAKVQPITDIVASHAANHAA